MAKVKTVALSNELIAQIHKAVAEGKAQNFNRLINDAIRAYLS